MRSFMCALRHDQSCNFIQYLEKYIDPMTPYLIGLETSKDTHQDTSGQHYHVCVNMTDKQYDSFRNTVLVKHYGLRGQARDGKARQYGTVKNVRDKTKMLQYTVKDHNIIYKNFTLNQIQELLDSSYHRPEKRDFHKELVQFLDSPELFLTWEIDNPDCLYGQTEINYYTMEKTIVEYLVKNSDKIPTKSLIQSLVRSYLIHRIKTNNNSQNIHHFLKYLRI